MNPGCADDDATAHFLRSLDHGARPARRANFPTIFGKMEPDDAFLCRGNPGRTRLHVSSDRSGPEELTPYLRFREKTNRPAHNACVHLWLRIKSTMTLCVPPAAPCGSFPDIFSSQSYFSHDLAPGLRVVNGASVGGGARLNYEIHISSPPFQNKYVLFTSESKCLLSSVGNFEISHRSASSLY